MSNSFIHSFIIIMYSIWRC